MSFPRGGRSCHWRLEGQERGILNVEPVLACSSQSAEGKAILVTFDPRTKDQDTRSLLALTGWTCSLLAVSKCTWSSMNCWTARKGKKKNKPLNWNVLWLTIRLCLFWQRWSLSASVAEASHDIHTVLRGLGFMQVCCSKACREWSPQTAPGEG